MNINGTNTLACLCKISEGDMKIYPLPHMYVLKDLVPDMSNFYEQHKQVKPFLQTKPDADMTVENYQSKADRAKLDGLYECVPCGCSLTAGSPTRATSRPRSASSSSMTPSRSTG